MTYSKKWNSQRSKNSQRSEKVKRSDILWRFACGDVFLGRRGFIELLKRWTATLHICMNIHFQTYQVHWVLSALPPKVLVENCWIDRMEESNEGHNCDVKISISPCSGQCHCYEFICVKFSIRMHLFGWYSVYSRTACNVWTAFRLTIHMKHLTDSTWKLLEG